VRALTEVRLPAEEFLRETERLVAAAESRGAPLRVCGSVGIYLAVRGDSLASRIYTYRDGSETPRITFKDLDLAAREKHAAAIHRLFVKELGFREDRETNALFGSFRNIFYHPSFQIDVFYDTLRFNHEIPIKDRLGPGVTLPREDLFLGKVQVHAPPRKDLVDLASFVAAVPIAQLDRAYLADFFGGDWGLWYDADLNLGAAAETIGALPRAISEADRGLVVERLREYRSFLHDCPKTRRWEKRRAKGTRERWYEPVDEIR
jgi:hypothetical protein